jgi:predicted nucleic acid-binding protein
VKNKAHDVTKYVFSKDEPLLLDANVWLYLFPAPSDKNTAPGTGYSAALKQILAAGAHLALDAMVISEYLNRYCRIEFLALHKTKYGNDFKRFRKSPDFASVGPNASFFAKEILKLCSRYDHPFSKTNIAQVLIDFESGALDLNDGLLIESCRLNGWKFVTHDGDCTSGGIAVLTTNAKLIAACP